MKYQNLYITIEQKLFNRLEKAVVEYNKYLGIEDSNKINMDMAVFLIYYIEYRKNKVRANSNKQYVRIPSKTLNKFLNKDLKKYRDFLTIKGFIKTASYSKGKNLAYGYKVIYKPAKDNKTVNYDVYEFLSLSYEKTLSKKLNELEEIERKKKSADRNTKHLTKWLNLTNIQIDWKNALSFINKSKKISIDKKQQYSFSVNKLRFDKWHYSRNGKSDNRLHSNLTNLPSVLRTFLSHKREQLVSLDIKSSQPYLLAGILNLFKLRDSSSIEFILKGIKSKPIKDKFLILMNSIFSEPIDTKGIEAYINLVCENDIYTYVGNNFSDDFISTIKTDKGIIDKIYCSISEHKKEIVFENLRAYCKFLTLEYFYCSIENNERRIKEISNILPNAVSTFIYNFKYCKELNKTFKERTQRDKEKIRNSKKLFPKFLQQLESFLILDVITKELSKQYPNLFMATIHDSIVTPVQHKKEVKAYLEKRLFEIFRIKANIKEEPW